jgi:hypothetical protein
MPLGRFSALAHEIARTSATFGAFALDGALIQHTWLFRETTPVSFVDQNALGRFFSPFPTEWPGLPRPSFFRRMAAWIRQTWLFRATTRVSCFRPKCPWAVFQAFSTKLPGLARPPFIPRVAPLIRHTWLFRAILREMTPDLGDLAFFPRMECPLPR